MSTFPLLKTGAVTQYPARRDLSFATSIYSFMDGSEQRFREFGSPLRRWVIELQQLDDAEMERLEAFFISEQGPYGVFSFSDPWDSTVFDNCSVENAEIFFDYSSVENGQTKLIVRQNR